MFGYDDSPPPGLVNNARNFTEMHIGQPDVYETRTGELIGRHEYIKQLTLCDIRASEEIFESFMRGVAKNRSIEDLSIIWCNGMWGNIVHILGPFFECNTNLRTLCLDYNETMGLKPEEWQHLSRSLEQSGSASLLERIILSRNKISDESAAGLIPYLAILPRLKHLDLSHNEIGSLGTAALAAMLVNPNSKLESLNLVKIDYSDYEMEILADALKSNKTLTVLNLVGNDRFEPHEPANDIGGNGWGMLMHTICDASSIQNTYLSNHTLLRVYPANDPPAGDEHDPLPPIHLRQLLSLNSCVDKKQVAVRKILASHHDMNMKPLFEWELRILPFAVAWFDKAKELIVVDIGGAAGKDNLASIDLGPSIDTRKFGAIYQFCKGLPEETAEAFFGAQAAGVEQKTPMKKRRFM